eukprot:GEMP01004674.1.p1 GENE.GEMP01004674.1~~GEMP01004674.1.p1  ORF type:complete len:670 (+),score=134.41 GEMP01004674.1:1399-3408(+)
MKYLYDTLFDRKKKTKAAKKSLKWQRRWGISTHRERRDRRAAKRSRPNVVYLFGRYLALLSGRGNKKKRRPLRSDASVRPWTRRGGADFERCRSDSSEIEMRHEAKQAFTHLEHKLTGKDRWTNSQPELPRHGKRDIFAFPPDDNSFFSRGRGDPDSLLPPCATPEYDMTDHGSTWRRLTSLSISPILFPHQKSSADSGKGGSYGRVFQGGLDNKYLVDALQVLSLRPRLLKSIFMHVDVGRSVFSVMMHKNGTWVKVEVDDFVPCRADGRPIPSISDHFPFVLWPTILEKAYAKLHVCGATGKGEGGWEVLGEGGDAAAALVDFTGGVGGGFSCKDVSPDRLFVYLHELQGEALFMCEVNQTMCQMRGVKLAHAFPYSINRVTQYEGRCYVQLHCGAPMLEDGGLQDCVPYTLAHHEDFTETEADGFFWMNIHDFHAYFDTIYEVRLVNSGSLGLIHDMPPPRLPMEIFPCHTQEGKQPMFEHVWAFGGTCYQDTAPEFHITVKQVPCEVFASLSQTDLRLLQKEPGRPFHHAFLLKTYERLDQKNCTYVCKSHWGHNRDSVVIFRVTEPGSYIIISALPQIASDGTPVEVKRLIFRVYSTTKVDVMCQAISSPYKVIAVPQVGAMKWTLIGASMAENVIRRNQPAEVDPTEGQGVPMAYTKKIDVDQ